MVGTIFATLLLLGVIAYGAYKLWPVYDAVRQNHDSPRMPANETATSATPSIPATVEPSAGFNDSTARPAVPAPNEDAKVPPSGTPPVTDGKTVEADAEKTAPKKIEATVSPKAAEFKQHVEEVIAQRGLTGRAKVQGVGTTLILAGRLRPGEHGALLKFLRDAPADIRVVDHIEYDDSPSPAPENADEGGHPVPAAGHGAIQVVTDVIGAAAVLHGPAGRVLNQCLTPCSFTNLLPARYSLEVKKDGYQPVETALLVKANSVSDQKLALESLAKGLLVSTQPAGANVFINGAKQSGQTPVTLPLAPGQYNLVLRLPGYEPYAGIVQVKDNIQTQLGVQLIEKSAARVAFAQVETNPQGAEILVDGNPIGKSTPSRIELPTGLHTLTLRLAGFQPVKRTVQVSEGGTVTIEESLRPR
jgi:hypothetical protein